MGDSLFDYFPVEIVFCWIYFDHPPQIRRFQPGLFAFGNHSDGFHIPVKKARGYGGYGYREGESDTPAFLRVIATASLSRFASGTRRCGSPEMDC
jgi:hypothetical protein